MHCSPTSLLGFFARLKFDRQGRMSIRENGFVVLRCVVVALATSFGSISAGAEILPANYLKAVVFVFRDGQPAAPPVPAGTGFFVTVPQADGTGGHGYFVTAKHVLVGDDGRRLGRIYLRLNTVAGAAEFLRVDLNSTDVYEPADSSVDLAVIPALPPVERFDYKAVPVSFLTTKASLDDLHISVGSEVFFVGLFVAFYGQERNFPIARFGRVAMLPGERIPWRDSPESPALTAELYLLETQSYGGNSGAPVFFFLGADRVPGSLTLGEPLIRLAGVMRGRFNDVAPVELIQVPTGTLPVVAQNIGIAAVTPSYLLRDLLFSDALVQQRRDTPIPIAP